MICKAGHYEPIAREGHIFIRPASPSLLCAVVDRATRGFPWSCLFLRARWQCSFATLSGFHPRVRVS